MNLHCYIILIAVLAIPVIFGFFPKAVAQNENNLLYYRNPNLGISLHYPSDWQQREYGRNVAFISPFDSMNDRFKELFTVSIGIPSTPLSLNQITDGAVLVYRSLFPNFQIIESSPMIVKGLPSYRLLFSIYQPSLGRDQISIRWL